MNFSPMLFIACIYILEVNIIQNDEHKHAFTFAMINATVKSIISGCCLLCYVHCQVFFKCSSFDYHTCLFISKVHVMSFGFFPSEFDPILLTLDYQCFDWLIFFYRTWFCQMLGTTRATPTTSITLTKLGVSSLYEVGLTRPLNQVPVFWSLKSLA